MKKVISLIFLSLLVSACSKGSSHSSSEKNKILPDDVDKVVNISISTENKQNITSKEDYLKATIEIDGLGKYKNYKGTGKIRGRGNSTWKEPKKPYKIKLDKKAGLLNMLPEKDWVLLANYIDPTLMSNATAMKIGQQLKVEYANHIIPVNVTINGKYQGQYNLTEQIEVKKNRVNVKGGVLLELDSYYDGKYKFKSAYYDLPVNFKYPKKVKKSEFKQVKHDINTLEKLMKDPAFPNNDYAKYFDKKAFADYFIVYMLTANMELGHPKSTYLHRKKGDTKFVMGPLWDFDYAYGYGYDGKPMPYFSRYDQAMFATFDDDYAGKQFFQKLLSDPEIKSLIKTKWHAYRKNNFQELLSYLDEYHQNTRVSKKKDYQLWHTGSGDIDKDYSNLKTWLKNRADFLDGYVDNL